jgi:nucleoside-diphosphate-sugar epimerase
VRVLLTGGNGFLGSHVADRFASSGAELRLMLRRTSKTDYLADFMATASFERVEGDLRDAESLRRAVEGVDVVAHVGGLTSAGNEDAYIAVNATGTAALVDAARSAGVRRFVYVSSLAAQGPSPDGRPLPLDVMRPITAYGRSKRDGEKPVLAAAGDMSVSVLRPPVIYGPRDEALLPLYRLIKLARLMPLYGDGLNQLSWVHVYDAADAIMRLSLAGGPSGGVYTIADGAPHTWRELADVFSQALGKRPMMLSIPDKLYGAAGRLADLLAGLIRRPLPLDYETVIQARQRYWVCDNAAIAREYGWAPKYHISAGMAQTVAWYREHGWL